MINAVTSQTTTNNENSIKDDVLKIDNIKTEKFDENTDKSIYDAALNKYSYDELTEFFTNLGDNNELSDAEKEMLTKNVIFLIKKKAEQEEKWETNDAESIKNDVLKIDNIKTEKFGENTDKSVYDAILNKYSYDELMACFVNVNEDKKLNDTEREIVSKNIIFLNRKKAEQEKKEQLEEIQNDKLEQKEEDLQKVDELKKLLSQKDEKIDNMQSEIDSLREELRNLSNNNSETLESLKTAKKSGDEKTIDQYKAQIDALTKERDALKDKYWWKLPEFGWEIAKLPTKKFEFKFLSRTKDKESWQTRLAWPEVRIRHNILARHKINVTIRKLNKLWKELWPDPEKNPDPKAVKKWVNYILNRSFLEDWWHIASACRGVVNTLRIKTTADLDKEFDIQKKYIIENLKAKMQDNLGENDKKTIEAVEKRIDYYQAAYKRMFIRV